MLSRPRAGAQATKTEQLNCTYGCVRRSRFGATLSNDAAARDKVVVCSLFRLLLREIASTALVFNHYTSSNTVDPLLFHFLLSVFIFSSLLFYSLLFSAMYLLLSPSILCYCIYFSFLFFYLFTLSTCEHQCYVYEYE